jgi:integrase
MPLKLEKRGKVYYVTGTIRRQRYRESTFTGSRPHAEAYRLKREREILDAEYHGEARTTLFAQAALLYLEKGGEGRFLAPLIERWGKWRLSDITPAAVSAFAREGFSAVAPATVKRQLYTPLNAVMRAAHRAQLGPLAVFEAPKVKRKPVAYADDRWLEQFFEHARFRVAAIVLFMTLTGARVSEACRLAPGDVDLERGEALLRQTKAGGSRRLPLAPVLVDALRTAIAECKKDIDGEVRVFGYANRWSVNQAIERVCLRAGIRRLSSHQVGRHAFAARLLAQGRSLQTVRGAGGWASIQIVSEVYGHLEQQAIDEAVRAAGESVPRLPGPQGASARTRQRSAAVKK